MGTFDSNNLDNLAGKLGVTYGDPTIVGLEGNVGATQANYIDMWNNVFLSTDPTGIGFLFTGTSTVVTKWTSNNSSLGGVVGSPVSIGAMPNYAISYTGAPSGTGSITVVGTGNSITNGKTGGGTVTFVNTQASNQGLTVQTGATANVGTPGTWTSGGFSNQMYLQTGATLNLSLNSASYTIYLQSQAGSTTNIIGNAGSTNTSYSFALHVSNISGTVNLVNCQLQTNIAGQTVTGTSTGVINVPAGSCAYSPYGTPSNVTYNLAGNGTGVSGQPDAALQFANNLTVSNPINLTASATIGANNPFTYTGQLTIPSGMTLQVGNKYSGLANACYYQFSGNQASTNIQGTIAVYQGITVLGNSGNYMPNGSVDFPASTATYQILEIITVQQLQSITAERATASQGYFNCVNLGSNLILANQVSTPLNTIFYGAGALNITGGDLETTAASTMTGTTTVSSGAAIGGGNAITGKVAALTMSAVGSQFNVTAISTSSASKLTCTTFTATSGFTVNVSGSLAAGTYPILVQTGTSTPSPTLGTNTSGRTVTFAWVAKTLNMILV